MMIIVFAAGIYIGADSPEGRFVKAHGDGEPVCLDEARTDGKLVKRCWKLVEVDP